MELKRRIPVVLTTWLALGSVLFWVPEYAEASEVSEIELTLESDPPEADVSVGSDGIVNVSGQVNCTINGTDEVKVFLWADSDIGAAFVTPSSFVFRGENGTEKHSNFTVTTRLPMGHSMSERPRVTINGYYIQNSLHYNLSNASCTIQIGPCYLIEAETPPPAEIGAGEFVYFQINITNHGNGEDIFEFILLNCPCEKEWTVATITPKVFLAGETKTITISGQAPQTWTLWRNEVQPIHVKILSQNSAEEGGDVKFNIVLHVRQRGQYIPGFSPTFAIIGIILVSLVLRTKGWNKGKKPKKSPCHPKDLYSELPMSMR
jgi:hypothetical protein